MQVSYNWLRELVDVALDPHQLAAKLTSIGTAVESVEPVAGNLDNIVVGKVVTCEPHPSKNTLKVCRVELGRDIQMTVVCGAPNVKVGIKAPLALPGAVLADNQRVQSAEIGGVLSEGVLCSQYELGISDDHSGLMEIEASIKSGSDLRTALNLDDYILGFDLTPNRADCLSAIGIAREISAITGSPIKRPAVEMKESSETAAAQVEIAIADPDACPRYAARVIRNVKIGRSPWWIQQRLLASGIRSINNVVDITNYVLLEYGQPLHAFDFDNFKQPKVLVRRAVDGETFTTLDGVERKLTPDVLLITDSVAPVAIGGIMGGQFSEVTEKTTNVLLEGAYFSASVIRRGRKHLGLISEAQTRFERGCDPNIVPFALDRAAALLEKYASGKVASGIVDVYPNKIEPVKLELRPSRVNQILDTELSSPTMLDVLNGLEFKVQPGKNLTVEVPTFRPDITREIDVIEEIARINGYEKIPVRMRAGGNLVTARIESDVFAGKVQQTLMAQGYYEVVTNSIGDPNHFKLTDPGTACVEIVNPISEDLKCLRPSLLAGLLNVVYQNVSHQVRTVKVFELGFVASARVNELPMESRRIGLALCGSDREENWAFHPGEFGLADIVGALESLSELATQRLETEPREHPTFDPTCSFDVLLAGSAVGRCGKVAAAMLKAFSIKFDVFLAEVDFSALLSLRVKPHPYKPLPRYPSSDRDMAVVVDEPVQNSAIIKVINEHADETLREILVFDVYRGKQVASGKKSIAYRLSFRDESKTLTIEEIDLKFNRIVEALKAAFGAELRS